jgi:hypothetical protein
MNKLNSLFVSLSIIYFILILVSCKKDSVNDVINSNDGLQSRLAYTEKGYTEIEVNPIFKIKCYFSDWDKEIITPVSGLFEYYDTDGNWVASIDFGDGTCDKWATKTWDVDVFTDYPNGTLDFSVFNYKVKK